MKKHGFTLVELSIGLGIAGSLALMSSHETKFENNQLKARALGTEVFEYNNAVQKFLSDNASSPEDIGIYPSSEVIFNGSGWLKGPACSSGEAAKPYLNCSAIPGGQTVQYGLQPRTTLSKDGDGALHARTVWAPSLVNEDIGGAELGLSALVASASYISTSESTGDAYQGPTVYCPDISSLSHTISDPCGSERNRIVSISSTSPSLDIWLRTDHGNTMRHAIEFGDSPSSQDALDLVDDGSSQGAWGGSGMRQIVNVARIYNRGGSGSDSLILGSLYGASIFSNSYLNDNYLLNDAVIIDGDVGIMRDMFVNSNAYIDGYLSTVGNIESSSGDIIAREGDIESISGDVRAGGNVRSINDVIAGNNIYADNNANVTNNVNVGNSVNVGRDVSVGNLIYGRAILDYNDPGVFSQGKYLMHMAGASRLRNLELTGPLVANNRVKLTRKEEEYSSCTGSFSYGVGYTTDLEGSIALSTSGNLVICKDGQWTPVGGTPSGAYSWFATSSCPTGWTYANGSNGTLDLRNQFIRGTSSGRNAGSIQEDAIRNITGEYISRVFSIDGNSLMQAHGGAYRQGARVSSALSSVGTGGSGYGYRPVTFDASRVVPTATENRPRNIAMRPCMKL